MSVVFADAFYFVARLNHRDQHHKQVITFSRDFRSPILTTDWVLMEVADALAKSECRSRIREFFLHLRQSSVCDVVPASRELLDQALVLYSQHSDKGWTLTDCTSFVVMRVQRITDALTADRHYIQAGFTVLFK